MGKKVKYYWAIKDMDNGCYFGGTQSPYLSNSRQTARNLKSILIPEVNWKIVKIKFVEVK